MNNPLMGLGQGKRTALVSVGARARGRIQTVNHDALQNVIN